MALFEGKFGAWRLAAAAVYGPHAACSLLSGLADGCGHCRETMWKLLPAGPGLMPVSVGAHLATGARLAESAEYALAAGISAALFLLVAWVVRKGGAIRSAAVGVATVLCAALAWGTLQAVRA